MGEPKPDCPACGGTGWVRGEPRFTDLNGNNYDVWRECGCGVGGGADGASVKPTAQVIHEGE